MSYKTEGMAFIRVSSIANLTRDPELRTTPSGNAICQFGIAINTKFKDASGADKEDVCFIDVEAWGKKGEAVAKFFTKGKGIYVDGRLKLDTWDDKTSGQKRSKHKIVLENFDFVGGKDSASAPQQQQTYEAPPARPRPAAGTPPPRDNSDEDVPF